MILTTDQLDQDCLAILDQVSSYNSLVHSLLHVMYHTGCREGEVLDRDRWSLVDPGVWQLIPQKGNPPRLVDQSSLTPAFIAWINSSGYPYRLSSLGNLRRIVDQFSAYPLATCGSKQISTHRFRHLRIRVLGINGYTVPEIKTYMGLVSSSVVNGYLNSVIES